MSLRYTYATLICVAHLAFSNDACLSVDHAPALHVDWFPPEDSRTCGTVGGAVYRPDRWLSPLVYTFRTTDHRISAKVRNPAVSAFDREYCSVVASPDCSCLTRYVLPISRISRELSPIVMSPMLSSTSLIRLAIIAGRVARTIT